MITSLLALVRVVFSAESGEKAAGGLTQVVVPVAKLGVNEFRRGGEISRAKLHLIVKIADL